MTTACVAVFAIGLLCHITVWPDRRWTIIRASGCDAREPLPRSAGIHCSGPFSNWESPSRETFLRFIHLKARRADRFSRSEKYPTSLGLWVSATISDLTAGKSVFRNPFPRKDLRDTQTTPRPFRSPMRPDRARRLQHSAGCRQAMTPSSPTCPHVIHNCVNPGTRSRRTRPSAVSKLSG